MPDMRIAIIGSGSHIAKGLTCNFLKNHQDTVTLFLFARSSSRVMDFLKHQSLPVKNCVVEDGYSRFMDSKYDVLINCAGAGVPSRIKGRYSDWFSVTEEYDNLCLSYLKKNSGSFYLNFSSGAVYGHGMEKPVEEGSRNCIGPNLVGAEDFYAIAKLNSEAKHRSHDALNIVDIRIFSYFSRFIDLESGYFLTDLLSCLLAGEVFRTGPANMVRDYIHPSDLFALVMKCLSYGKLNRAFDAVSRMPVEKSRILEYYAKRYGLRYEVDDKFGRQSPNGVNDVYCASSNRAGMVGYEPVFSSLETIEQESQDILKGVCNG